MHLSCRRLEAVFPGAQTALVGQAPISFTLDCHDRPPFVIKLFPVAAQPLPESAVTDLIAGEVTLPPDRLWAAGLEVLAAAHKLVLLKPKTIPEILRENLILAACHVAETKTFIFSEHAVLDLRTAGPGSVAFTVTGPFRVQRLPCRESDVILHLEAPAAARVVSYFLAQAGAAT